MNSRRFYFVHLFRRTQLTQHVARAVAAKGVKSYEFPTGYNCNFGVERFEVGEIFFVHPQHLQVKHRES